MNSLFRHLTMARETNHTVLERQQQNNEWGASSWHKGCRNVQTRRGVRCHTSSRELSNTKQEHLHQGHLRKPNQSNRQQQVLPTDLAICLVSVRLPVILALLNFHELVSFSFFMCYCLSSPDDQCWYRCFLFQWVTSERHDWFSLRIL